MLATVTTAVSMCSFVDMVMFESTAVTAAKLVAAASSLSKITEEILHMSVATYTATRGSQS